jgi:twinkle protein
MIVRTLADVGIEIPHGTYGEIDVLCPQCSPTRKKRSVRCLSVNTIDGTWYCHHCGWAGALGANSTGYGARLAHRAATPLPPRVYVTPPPPPSGPVPEQVIQYFADRGIPEHVLTAAGISAGQEWCPQLAGYVLAIRFPYWRNGALVNIKYRAAVAKAFWMVKGAQRILYGLDAIARAETICGVEGEIDKLSIDTAGGPPTVSVPDGAPPPDAKHYASKFAFLDETAMARLTAATTVLIGTDMDAPGQRLAEELARRFGHARCKRVSWHPYKDANEMLVAQGPQAILNALANAQPVLVPKEDEIPHGMRPVRMIPSVRGRRPIVDLPGMEAHHAS